MLMAILEFRARVCELYQKLQLIIDPIFKFLLSFLVIRTLNTVIGYDPRLSSTLITLALSLVCAFLPSAVLALVCMLLTVAHVLYVNLVLAAFVALILIVLYCFFLRFAPKYGYVMIAVPILFLFRVPYLVPLLMGLVATPLTILPMACGIFFYSMINVIQKAAALQVDVTKLDMEAILLVVNNVVDNLISNKEVLLTILVYSIVLVAVFAVRRMEFDYSFEIAILVGVVVSIFGHMLLDSKYPLEQGMGSVVLFNILAGILVFVIYFFIRILDYTAVEHVQFEDDDYYYYVRAVPKIKVGLPQLNIKRFNDKSYFNASMENEEDDMFDPGELERKLLEKRTREAGLHDQINSGRVVIVEEPEAADSDTNENLQQ